LRKSLRAKLGNDLYVDLQGIRLRLLLDLP
jgi:hypothetical protein